MAFTYRNLAVLFAILFSIIKKRKKKTMHEEPVSAKFIITLRHYIGNLKYNLNVLGDSKINQGF